MTKAEADAYFRRTFHDVYASDVAAAGDARTSDACWTDTPPDHMLCDSGARRCVAGAVWHSQFQQ
eukprot:14528482-Alexandrium_andersonii.AAC.1